MFQKLLIFDCDLKCRRNHSQGDLVDRFTASDWHFVEEPSSLAYYRQRASALRARAEKISDPQAMKRLLDVAASYDQLTLSLELRQPPKQ